MTYRASGLNPLPLQEDIESMTADRLITDAKGLLQRRVEEQGSLSLVEDAVIRLRRALHLLPSDDPSRPELELQFADALLSLSQGERHRSILLKVFLRVESASNYSLQGAHTTLSRYIALLVQRWHVMGLEIPELDTTWEGLTLMYHTTKAFLFSIVLHRTRENGIMSESNEVQRRRHTLNCHSGAVVTTRLSDINVISRLKYALRRVLL